MADVFISYAREDRTRADQIARGLQAMGLECFWDTEIPPGQTWADYIEGKLAACKAVIVLWSAHSTGSQWVREEARMGRDKGKLIPALLDASPAPFGFGEVQAANLANWNGQTNHPDWVRFSNAVDHAVRGPNAAPRTAPPPQPSFTAAMGAMTASASPAEENTPIGYIKKCLRLYVNGKGRARRSEYWWWTLFVVGVSVVATIIDIAVSGFNSYTSQPNSPIFSTIVALAVLCPGLSVMSRRFHDVGLSGWLVAAVFAGLFVGGVLAPIQPALGGIVTLAAAGFGFVVALLPSKPGDNQYGPNPKGQ
ncbi:hypothetical protein U91I_04067 [alpha proteobacterium U9-1i]|nr:hypothetical protein U91I_04067 [alpha proteobacterium U9-1i]